MIEQRNPSLSPSQVERIERALAVAAYIVLKHGQDYAPIFERLERELEAARNSPEERARRVLEAYVEKKGRASAEPSRKRQQLK